MYNYKSQEKKVIERLKLNASYFYPGDYLIFTESMSIIDQILFN